VKELEDGFEGGGQTLALFVGYCVDIDIAF
jgi:hypothetical protein